MWLRGEDAKDFDPDMAEAAARNVARTLSLVQQWIEAQSKRRGVEVTARQLQSE